MFYDIFFYLVNPKNPPIFVTLRYPENNLFTLRKKN